MLPRDDLRVRGNLQRRPRERNALHWEAVHLSLESPGVHQAAAFKEAKLGERGKARRNGGAAGDAGVLHESSNQRLLLLRVVSAGLQHAEPRPSVLERRREEALHSFVLRQRLAKRPPSEEESKRLDFRLRKPRRLPRHSRVGGYFVVETEPELKRRQGLLVTAVVVRNFRTRQKNTIIAAATFSPSLDELITHSEETVAENSGAGWRTGDRAVDPKVSGHPIRGDVKRRVTIGKAACRHVSTMGAENLQCEWAVGDCGSVVDKRLGPPTMGARSRGEDAGQEGCSVPIQTSELRINRLPISDFAKLSDDFMAGRDAVAVVKKKRRTITESRRADCITQRSPPPCCVDSLQVNALEAADREPVAKEHPYTLDGVVYAGRNQRC